MNSEDRLDSLKAIAKYLNRDIKTVYTWSRKYKLPIHRIDETSVRSRVFAFKSELDQWFLKLSTKN